MIINTLTKCISNCIIAGRVTVSSPVRPRPERFRRCRAAALAKADPFSFLLRECSELSTRQAIPLLPELKIENRQKALGLLPEIVRAPEMPTRMPGFECALVAAPGDQ